MDDKNPLSDSEEKLVLELSGPAMMVGAGMHLLQALGQGRAKEERERAVGPLNGSVLQFSQCEWGQNHSIKHLPLPSIPRPSAYNFQPHFPVSLFSFFPFFSPSPLPPSSSLSLSLCKSVCKLLATKSLLLFKFVPLFLGHNFVSDWKTT